MQNIVRKVYLSIMFSMLCMITLVTATFAWIGFLDFSNFQKFDINLNSSELEEYGIEISLTGEAGTFGSSVDDVELKKIILKNYGYTDNYISKLTKDNIDNVFNSIRLDQCSVIPNSDKSFPDFIDIDNKKTTKYFKFDIYISAFQAFDSGENNDYFLNAYLIGELFKGTKDTRDLINEYTYPSNFVNSAPNGILADTSIYKSVTIDSSSACRLAIQKYDVVEKFDVNSYNDNSNINDYIILQGGTALPTYDSKNNIYSFGGIMEESYNLALYDYNKKYPDNKKTIPNQLFSRGDVEFKNNYQIINSSKTEEKIGVNQMMKMTIYFWFEGWDADCFDIIDNNPVTLNLNFSTNFN